LLQQTDGSIIFASWRQCALLNPEGTLAPLANTTELVLPLAHHRPQPKPNGKSIGSAIFTQLMTQYCWAHWRKLANTIEHVLLQPTRVHTQMANPSVQQFLHSSGTLCGYLCSTF